MWSRLSYLADERRASSLGSIDRTKTTYCYVIALQNARPTNFTPTVKRLVSALIRIKRRYK